MIIEINLIWAIVVYIVMSIAIYLYLEWFEDNREVFKSLIISTFWGGAILLPILLLGVGIYRLYDKELKYWVYLIKIIVFPYNVVDAELNDFRAKLWDIKNRRKTLFDRFRYIAHNRVAKHNNIDINTITEKDAHFWSPFKSNYKYDC